MSYILDALRKSEEERRRGELPGIQSYEQPESEKKAKVSWGLIAFAIVLMNVVVMLFFAPWDQKASIQVDQPEMTQSQATAKSSVAAPVTRPEVLETKKHETHKFTAPQRVKQKPTLSKPVPSNDVIASNRSYKPEPSVTPAEEQATTPQAYYLPQLSELPQHIQSQIPTLQFSSHMFSSQERFRSITINDRRSKQGQFYSEALLVKEITETGAILSFNDTLFEVDVIGQWGN